MTDQRSDSGERVLVRTAGRVGEITLNRPEAINAIELGMVRGVRRALDRWRDDPQIDVVVIRGAGERGFCAGGDIRASQDDDSGFTSEEFLREEYDLNLVIATYPKPYVAIMHGIVLGGGVGLSAHGSHRIVTDSTKIGMPEVGIGFIPDVGGTHLLSRSPGELGTYLALTGGSVGAADAIELGLADAYVPEERLADLISRLESHDPDAVISGLAMRPPGGTLAAHRAWIDADFAGDSVAHILDELERRDVDEAQAARRRILRQSPTALTLALRALREAADTDLPGALQMEFRVAVRAFDSAELAEGVRAQLIDKDRQPRWNPTTLAEVSETTVSAYFAALPQGPLEFTAP